MNYFQQFNSINLIARSLPTLFTYMHIPLLTLPLFYCVCISHIARLSAKLHYYTFLASQPPSILPTHLILSTSHLHTSYFLSSNYTKQSRKIIIYESQRNILPGDRLNSQLDILGYSVSYRGVCVCVSGLV